MFLWGYYASGLGRGNPQPLLHPWILASITGLFGEFNRPCFSNNIYFNYTGILQSGFNFCRYITGHFYSLEVIDMLRFDDDAQFTASRDGIALVYTREGISEILQLSH